VRALSTGASGSIFHQLTPEGSLPYSQKPATRPILSQINPIHTTPYFCSIHYSIIPLSTPRSSLPFRFHDQNFVRIFHPLMRATCFQISPSLDLITQKIFGEANCEPHHCAMFSILLLLSVSYAYRDTLLSTLFTNLSIFVLSLGWETTNTLRKSFTQAWKGWRQVKAPHTHEKSIVSTLWGECSWFPLDMPGGPKDRLTC